MFLWLVKCKTSVSICSCISPLFLPLPPSVLYVHILYQISDKGVCIVIVGLCLCVSASVYVCVCAYLWDINDTNWIFRHENLCVIFHIFTNSQVHASTCACMYSHKNTHLCFTLTSGLYHPLSSIMNHFCLCVVSIVTQATPFVRRALDLNPAQPGPAQPVPLTPLSVISGWEDCPSDILTRWLTVAAQACMASASLRETSRWRTSVGMQKSVYLDRNLTKGRPLPLKDDWKGCLRGFELNLFLPLIAKRCNMSTHKHPSLKGNMYQSIDRLIHCP